MADSSLRVEVPGFDAMQIAREAVAVRFAEAMVGSEDAIKKIVVAALTQKVTDRGQVGSSYENKTPFMEWVCQDLIRSAAIEVCKAKIQEMRPAIEKAVEKELARGASQLAKVMTEHFVNQAQHGYLMNVSISLAERSR
jgi:ribosomal protein L17